MSDVFVPTLPKLLALPLERRLYLRDTKAFFGKAYV